ncbi:MAG: hypothetical protein OWQ54_01105 [Sulfolobaceae archaeon]|nr:hypothetical protein [Sulfolobaceae archaeon]
MRLPRYAILGLAVIVIILIGLGIVATASYKTRIYTEDLGGQPHNGKYELAVKIIINYGYFGGKQPLSQGVVYLYRDGVFYNWTFTNSSGVAVFYVPPGNYTVLSTTLKIKTNVIVNSNEEVIFDYAYLVSS